MLLICGCVPQFWRVSFHHLAEESQRVLLEMTSKTKETTNVRRMSQLHAKREGGEIATIESLTHVKEQPTFWKDNASISAQE